MTDDEIMYAIGARMRTNEKYRQRLSDAIESGSSWAIEQLIIKAVEKVYGVIIRVGTSMLQSIRSWFGV